MSDSGLSYWKILTRKKALTFDGENEKLGRILDTFDLTALGVGATLGVGVYVLAGHVARQQAGPSVVLSFAIAAAASFLAGLCYAEFGARVPKSGSAYIYSYVCIGEFMAFIIGWNLMLEYIIGSASVSRGLSLYLDTLLNDTMKREFIKIAPIKWDFLSNYFDFFSFTIAILLGIALAFGLKKSTIVNNFFTILNMGIVLFVIISGSFKANIENWRLVPNNIDEGMGKGGFFPFGFEGTLKGAATCFFGFVGFDCIATTGEEVRDPRRAIPRAILYSLCIIFLSYFGVSTVLTLMWPYYLQDINAPLPFVFNAIGWNFAKWVVAIGGIIGLVASLFGAMFPQPRIIYAMAQDGLIFRALGEVDPKYKTPVFGTLCAAALTGVLSGIFDLKALVNMLSIGTLMAYTVVAISILILRFSDGPESLPSSAEAAESSNLVKSGSRVTCSAFIAQIFNLSCKRTPTKVSTSVIGVLVLLYCTVSIALALLISYAEKEIFQKEPWAVAVTSILSVFLLLILLAMSVQPRETVDSPFKVPLVPLLPCVSIFVNIYLMLMLDVYTWIRFGIWMAIGLPMYFACVCCRKGTRKSKLEITNISAESYDMDHGKYNEGFKEDSEDIVVNGKSVLGFEVLSYEEEETIGSTLTQSHSPKTSLDDIALVSEMADTLTEKKEANGNAYFVEDESTQNQPDSLLSEEKETNRAIALLDDVLKDEEENIKEKSKRESTCESLGSPVFRAYSTVADIHQEDQLSIIPVDEGGTVVESETVEQNSLTPGISGRTSPSIGVASPFEISEDKPLDPVAPDTDKEVITLENLDFIEVMEVNAEQRSSPIESNDNEEVQFENQDISRQEIRIEPKKERAAFIVGKDDDTASLKSEDIDYTMFGKQKQKQFLTKLSTLLITPKPPSSPAHIVKQDEEDERLEKECSPPLLTRSKSEPNFQLLLQEIRNRAVRVDDVTGESYIPAAPKFDPLLYNTVGKSQFSRLKSSPAGEVKPFQIKLKPVPIKDPDDNVTDGNNNIVESDNSVAAFKNKLESLLRRGPSMNKPKPQLVEPKPQPDALDENQEVEIQNFRPASKPFDTVHKQKMLFDDVLKSINSDTRPSNIRNSSENKINLSDIKNGLRKTGTPKQFLSNV